MATKLVKDLTGTRFGRRVVTGCGRVNGYHKWWTFHCDCGFVGETLHQSLKRSPGCVWCSHKAERPYRRKRPYEAQYNNFVSRARFPVTITYKQYAELAKEGTCHYCKAEVIWSVYRRADTRGGNGSNLDRKDYRKGYSIDNIVVCCGRCNYAKGTHFTYDEWKEIGALIKTWKTKCTQPVTPISGRALAKLERELTK